MTTECVRTTYRCNAKGYGKCNALRFGRRIHYAHILAWIDRNGCLPPPDRPLILHSCDNPWRVNPDHLRAGTNAENMRDRVERRSHPHHRKAHCVHGHPFTQENTQRRNGRRHCKACADKRWRQRFDSGHRRVRKSGATDPTPCPQCGKHVGLKVDGGVFAHTRTGIRGDVRCPGSGLPPVRAELRTLGLDGAA